VRNCLLLGTVSSSTYHRRRCCCAREYCRMCAASIVPRFIPLWPNRSPAGVHRRSQSSHVTQAPARSRGGQQTRPFASSCCVTVGSRRVCKVPWRIGVPGEREIWRRRRDDVPQCGGQHHRDKSMWCLVVLRPSRRQRCLQKKHKCCSTKLHFFIAHSFYCTQFLIHISPRIIKQQ
jgi:hypothetical protein